MDELAWRKSSWSNQPSGECVEVGFAADAPVGVRDTKDRDGGQLTLEAPAWEGLLANLK